MRVEQLYDWENQWLEFHFDHNEPGPDNEGNDVRFGLLPDCNPNEGEEKPEYFLRCSAVDRPRKKAASLGIRASGEFVTIHDLVSTVHPWLMGLRDKMLQAEPDLLDNIPLPPDTKLVVHYPGPESENFGDGMAANEVEEAVREWHETAKCGP